MDEIIEEAPTSNVVNLLQFRKDKEQKWPTESNKEVEVTASVVDPTQRKILIDTLNGPVVVEGYLGLSQTFLAIGRPDGSIKFAAAPGQWLYAADVTDNPEYSDTAE